MFLMLASARHFLAFARTLMALRDTGGIHRSLFPQSPGLYTYGFRDRLSNTCP